MAIPDIYFRKDERSSFIRYDKDYSIQHSLSPMFIGNLAIIGPLDQYYNEAEIIKVVEWVDKLDQSNQNYADKLWRLLSEHKEKD